MDISRKFAAHFQNIFSNGVVLMALMKFSINGFFGKSK